MDKLFFDSWDGLLRTLILTILAYVALVFLLRISGKRTLSKMNAFDFVVTIALGSTLATVLLNKNVALLEGILALALLIFLQYAVSWLSVRIPVVKSIVASQPALLVYKGEVLEATMKKERIKIEEIYLSAREKGISQISEIDAAVLETTGNITIIPKMNSLSNDALSDVMSKGI